MRNLTMPILPAGPMLVTGRAAATSDAPRQNVVSDLLAWGYDRVRLHQSDGMAARERWRWTAARAPGWPESYREAACQNRRVQTGNRHDVALDRERWTFAPIAVSGLDITPDLKSLTVNENWITGTKAGESWWARSGGSPLTDSASTRPAGCTSEGLRSEK